MFRLALLLAAAGYIYSLGQHSATPDAAKSNGIGSVATAVARQVHEQTAWAANGPAPAQPPAPVPAQVPAYPSAMDVQPQPVVAEYLPAPAPPPTPRGLKVVFEPEFTVASR